MGDTPVVVLRVFDVRADRLVCRLLSVRSRIGVGMGSRVELYAAIRCATRQRNQMSIRALAAE